MCAMPNDMRSLTVTPELVRDMTRDVATLLLRTRQTMVLWGLLGFAAVAGAVVVATRAMDPLPTAVLCLAVPASALAVLLGTRRFVRRALSVAFPPGATVGARVERDALCTRGVLGSSQTSLAAYRELRVRGSAAVLRLRGSAAYVVLPSALFTGDDLAVLDERVTRG
jgi:hypothetical protein